MLREVDSIKVEETFRDILGERAKIYDIKSGVLCGLDGEEEEYGGIRLYVHMQNVENLETMYMYADAEGLETDRELGIMAAIFIMGANNEISWQSAMKERVLQPDTVIE